MTAPNTLGPPPAGKVPMESPKKPALNVVKWLDARWKDEEHKRWMIVFYRDRFWIWRDAHWRVLDELTVRSLVYEVFEHAVYPGQVGSGQNAVPAWVDFDVDAAKMANLMQGLKDKILVDREIEMPVWFDVGESIPMDPQPVDPREIVPTRDGLLHAPTRQVWGNTPRFFNAFSVGYAYDPEAQCPQWKKFLESVWPEDPDSVRALRQIFGYLLTQRNDLQKMFVLYGAKRGGKGTIIRILTSLLGTENVTATSMSELKGDFALGSLEGKTMAVMSDLRFRGKDDGAAVERLLKITGNDQVMINRKNKQPYDATLSTRFLIASNELPRLHDESGAIQTRIILLKFVQSFLGREDPTLEARLRAELPGILNWALDGLDDLTASGRFLQPESAEEELVIIEHLASPFQAFVQDCCILSPAGRRAKDEMYLVYEAWCKANNMQPTTQNGFTRGLKAVDNAISNRGKAPDPTGRKQREAYSGIDLNDNGVEILQRQVALLNMRNW